MGVKLDCPWLPEAKVKELETITNLIVRTVPVDMIILFGSYATGEQVADRYIKDGVTYEYMLRPKLNGPKTGVFFPN